METPEQMEALWILRRTQDRITDDGSTCSASQIEGDGSNSAETIESQVQLPEDILHQIHALLPMRDAAQAACVSRAFLRSWRYYPNLILSTDSLCIKEYGSNYEEFTKDFVSRVNHILQNHSGMGVKEFRLQSYPCSTLDPSYVDRWLQVAITPGIEEFELSLFEIGDIKYKFPCCLLSSERGSSIQSLMLAGCSVRCIEQVGCMSSLTKLDLHSVDITGEELLSFLSNSSALEKISLSNCDDIVCLKIPNLLQQLNILDVLDCEKLDIIDSNAPYLSNFTYVGSQIHISLGNAMHVRKIRFNRDFSSDALCYAITKLPFIAPNLQTLFLSTIDETMDTPPGLGRFLHLKYLEIMLSATYFSPLYDFYSLVSFLDASPALETFLLRIGSPSIRFDSIVDEPDGDSSFPRCLSERCHENLKNVMITGFCSAKSMIELTLHIMQKAKSLECLTLDTTRGHDRRFERIDKCWPLSEEAVVEAGKARVAIQRHIEGRVPSGVCLKVIEPCSKCTYTSRH